MKSYYVYILSNSTSVLYTGVTNDLERRLVEHRTKMNKGFSSKYGTDRLVYYEEFSRPDEAIAAEKRSKACYERRNWI